MASFRSDRSKKPYTRPPTDGQWLHDKAPRTSRAPTGNGNNPSNRTNNNSGLNSKLVVSNLHYEITAKDLTAIFGQIGTLVREPLIRYDRSGRSIGVAIISFETPSEATRAKTQFDGILAKGQAMSIVYDTAPPKGPRRVASAPSSLLHRIEKTPLAERLGTSATGTQDDSGQSLKRPTGPIRSRRGGGGGGGAPRAPKKPKTAEDLDKELDLFMGDSPQEATAAAPATAGGEDVEMA